MKLKNIQLLVLLTIVGMLVFAFPRSGIRYLSR